MVNGKSLAVYARLLEFIKIGRRGRRKDNGDPCNAPGMYGKFGWKDSMRGLNNDAYTKNKCGIFSGRTIDENVPEEAVGLRSCVDGA